MEIPDCYDPVSQAERREQEWDQFLNTLPRCSCCGEPIQPGKHFWVLKVIKNTLIVCKDCKDDMEENEDIVEDMYA